MTDKSTPPKLDFFTKLVGVNFPGAGRVLLTLVADNQSDPPGACVSPSFTLGSKAKLLDKTERCTKVTVPAHTITTTFYFAWAPQFSIPTEDNYRNHVGHGPPPYDLYATQFPWIFGYPNRPVGANDPPGLTLDPDDPDLLLYISVINAELAASPGSSFGGFDPDGVERIFIATNLSVESVTVHVDVPALTTATLRGKYLFEVPFKKVGDSAVIGADINVNWKSDLIAQTFQQNVNKIDKLGAPVRVAEEKFTGHAIYTVTTERITEDKRAILDVTVEVEGGGGGG